MPSKELVCTEYCFRHCVNPFQHPCLDPKVHHLTALLTALSNTCGGVIQLCGPERTALDEGQFSSYMTRLLSLPGIHEHLVETSQGIGNSSWATIAAKKCRDTLQCEFENTCVKLWIDNHGQLQQTKCKCEEGQEILKDNGGGTPSPVLTGFPDVEDNPSSSKISESSAGATDDKVEATVQSPTDFSTFHELNWDQNKKNWQEKLTDAKQSLEEVIGWCDIWEPRFPMKMTPDREAIKRLFLSDDDAMATIRRVETKTPGFAITSTSWISLLPELGLQPPTRHLCDILTVAEGDGVALPQASVCLWVIVSSSTEQVIQRQVEYMFIIGRAIKYQLSLQSKSNLAIHCMLHSTRAEDNAVIDYALQKLETKHMQKFLCSAFKDTGTFDGLQRRIAQLLLSRESTIKTCAGAQLSVKLSAQQATELLKIKSRQVSYVSSAPGTGKTLCGIALYKEYGKDRSVYISPTEPLFHYLRYNGCDATLVRNDKELSGQMKCGTFDNKVCVIIDESHHLICSKAGLKKLFKFMKENQMRLFVFADNTYQSFDRANQQKMQTYIDQLSREVWGEKPYEPIFTEMYRNTRKVVSFLQHSGDVLDITCGNTHDGDGIQCIAMENLVDNSSDNPLVQYLRPLLDTRYQVTDIAVLLDSGYTDGDINSLHRILQRHLPRVTTQFSTAFPREGIIVDRVESFAGLDAAMCMFLLSVGAVTKQDANIANPRYRVFLASRATHKAVFVVPRIAADLVNYMKFDHFLVSVTLLVYVVP